MSRARLPLALGSVLVVVWVGTLIKPAAGYAVWLLEVGPALAGFVALAITYRRFPMSRMVYVAVFVHALILTYGGYYTYALTPLGNWARDAFHLSRNHYDRVGHVALGLFPAIVIREVLMRATPLRGGWLHFCVVCVAFSIAAFYELIEWWAAVLLTPGTGDAFLGSQGDVWDAQWDMFLGLVGAVFTVVALRGLHDRSMARTLPATSLPRTT